MTVLKNLNNESVYTALNSLDLEVNDVFKFNTPPPPFEGLQLGPVPNVNNSESPNYKGHS